MYCFIRTIALFSREFGILWEVMVFLSEWNVDVSEDGFSERKKKNVDVVKGGFSKQKKNWRSGGVGCFVKLSVQVR